MRAIVQRVSGATATVEGRIRGQIGRGLLVLLGVARANTLADATFLADRIVGMRVFADNSGKMNLAIGAVGGELLVVPQFTLHADTSQRRPSFVAAAPRSDARRLYETFLSLARQSGVKVEEGQFGARMRVELVNDGPVTIILDSRNG
ncbi:MAG: D-aminoacyl-tRNA deacylase [Candidatus Binataceae bacterium]